MVRFGWDSKLDESTPDKFDSNTCLDIAFIAWADNIGAIASYVKNEESGTVHTCVADGNPLSEGKTKTKKKHFVAQKVKLFRASDPLLSVLMWGVNHSVRTRAAARSPFPPPLPPRSPPPLAAAAAGRGARAGPRPSGC